MDRKELVLLCARFRSSQLIRWRFGLNGRIRELQKSSKMKIILEVEGRCKILFIDGGSVESLRTCFNQMCKLDPVLKGRIVTHYPTFMSYNQSYGLDLELEFGEELTDGQRVKVFFAPYAANDAGGGTESSTQSKDSSSRGNVEIEYLKSIGMRVGPSSSRNTDGIPKASTAPTSTASKAMARNTNGIPKASTAATSTASKGATKGTTGEASNKRQMPDSSDDDDDYAKESENAKQQNLAALKELNIELPKRIKLQKRKAPNKGKGSKPTREQPRRTVRNNKENNGLLEPEQQNQADQDSGRDGDDFDSLLGEATDSAPENLPVERRKPDRRVRLIGQKITKYIPLPAFDDELKKSFMQGLVYRSQPHTQKMNTFLKDHVQNITKDSYPTKGEYVILQDQVMDRLRAINAPDLDFCEKQIVKSLSASIRNVRNWKQNKKMKYEAAKQLLLIGKEAQPPKTSVTSRSLSPTQADQILRLPVKNKDNIRAALAAASSITPSAIHTLSVKCAMDAYPYLKHTDLLMEDFAMRLDSTTDKFQENFETALLPLAKILSLECPEDELAKARLLGKVNNYFEEDSRHFPCLQFCDVSIQTNEVLQTIPEGQAPALLLVLNDRSIVSAVVAFNKETLCHMLTPRAFECVVLLLAMYFIFNIEYPPAYKKLLLAFEYLIRGEDKISRIGKEVKTFFQKLFEAKSLLQT